MITLKDLQEGNIHPMLKPREVMEALNMGRYTFYNLVRAGKLPHVKYGNRILIPANKLLEWLENAQ
mgnify:CR=1 FL=1